MTSNLKILALVRDTFEFGAGAYRVVGYGLSNLLVRANLVERTGSYPFVWLAILSEWGHIFGGIAAACLMPFVFAIAQVPSLPLIPLTERFANTGRAIPVVILMFLSAFWTSVLMTAWCVLVFFTSIADIDYQNTFIHP